MQRMILAATQSGFELHASQDDVQLLVKRKPFAIKAALVIFPAEKFSMDEIRSFAKSRIPFPLPRTVVLYAALADKTNPVWREMLMSSVSGYLLDPNPFEAISLFTREDGMCFLQQNYSRYSWRGMYTLAKTVWETLQIAG